jgi:spore coat protein H
MTDKSNRHAIHYWWFALIFLAVAAQAKPLPGASDDLFTNNVIRLLRLEIPEAGLDVLRQYAWHGSGSEQNRQDVSGTVREGDAVYTNVSVHLKGGAGSFRPVDDKPGLTLHFNQQAKNQRFHGLSKISLNNSAQDPTFISDKLCREIFLQAGVPVPRADYAVVELNGRVLGLYVLTEGWDKTFLKRHFGEAKGSLYSPSGAGDLHRLLESGAAAKPEAAAKFARIATAATNVDTARRVGELRPLIDLDRFFTMQALDNLMWNWDGYGMNKNNYRVYDDPATGKLVFMPHGMDQMFWKPNGPIVTGRNGVLARGLLQTEEGRQLLLNRLNQVYPSLFNVGALTNRVMALANRIRPALVFEGLQASARHNRSVAVLCRRIAIRCQSIDEQLAGLKNAPKIAVGETVTVSDWIPLAQAGEPVLDRDPATGALHIKAQQNSCAAWVSTLWLEEGTYTLKGRVKTDHLVSGDYPGFRGAGLRVMSNRKQSDGPHWDWFPYHESNDHAHRGEVAPENFRLIRLMGTRDWTEITYEIELRQPLADLEVLCEAAAASGEVWFDAKSLQITRHSAICP